MFRGSPASWRSRASLAIVFGPLTRSLDHTLQLAVDSFRGFNQVIELGLGSV